MRSVRWVCSPELMPPPLPPPLPVYLLRPHRVRPPAIRVLPFDTIHINYYRLSILLTNVSIICVRVAHDRGGKVDTMLSTSYTERFGEYTVLVSVAEGYTLEDGVLVVEVFHNKGGLVDSHVDGMTLENARDHALEAIKNHLERTPTLYMGFDEVEILAIHNDKILLKDSSDYIIASHTAFVWSRCIAYADIREYSMNHSYKGFSKYFNREDIHHALELV